jgi:TonB family protein
MRRWSLLVALAAMLLSLLLHGIGLRLTLPEGPPSSTEEAASDMSDVGAGFEDLAETVAEPAPPEPATPAAPPDVTPPDEVTEATPTSQALVASDTPQDVLTPGIGPVEVVEPDAASPSESDTPAPETETAEPPGGEDETEADVADMAVTQPIAPETQTPAQTPAQTEQASEAAPVAVTEAVPPIAPPSDSAPPPEPDMQAPLPPEITVASVPDDAEILAAEETGDLSGAAVTTSLRPPKARPSAAALATPEAGPQQGAQTGRAAGVIESPLTTYKRTGIDPFASRRSGARSSVVGLQGAFNPGNSSTTNYAGEVLVKLNRAPPVFPSAQGTAQVSFEISPDGTVAWVNILSSTGSPDIVRAASAQVRRAAPFPRPPGGTSQRLVFVYRNR